MNSYPPLRVLTGYLRFLKTFFRNLFSPETRYSVGALVSIVWLWAGGSVCVAQLDSKLRTAALSPAAELATMELADKSLRVEFVVGEPDIVSPVAVAWDENGAMYVVEMLGYPLAPNSGKIKRLEDRNGDGHYDRVTDFATELNSPTGVMPFRGGILVTAAPDILFFRDSDNDGVADERQVVWTGFREGNQQLRVNGLYWGLDNWIYGANGRSGGTIHKSESAAKVSIDQSDFRFHPDEDRFEAITGMSQFGLAHDSWGNRFISWNHRFARQVMLDAAHLRRNPRLVQHSIVDTAEPGDDRRVYFLSDEKPIFNQDPGGYFTSLSGLTVYRGDRLGESYVGDAFAGESAQGVVVHRRFDDSQAALVARRVFKDKDFLAASDNWFHPVNFATGPDGSLYIVDFYRQLVEHPQWAHAEKRDGVDWQVGAEHGRIWRVLSDDSPNHPSSDRFPRLGSMSTGQLVATLSHPVGWWRDTAQRLIVERQDMTAVEFLQQTLISDSAVSRLHAMWTLQGLNALTDSELSKLIADANPRIRSQAIQIAEQRFRDHDAIRKAVIARIGDPDGECRYQVGLALGSLPDTERLTALGTYIQLNSGDPQARLAVQCSAGSVAGDLVRLILAQESFSIDQHSLLYELGSLAARENADSRNAAVWLVARGIDPKQSVNHFIAVAGMLAGLRKHEISIRNWLLEPPSKDLQQLIAGTIQCAVVTANDDQMDSNVRHMAIATLSLGPPDSVGDALLNVAQTADSVELQRVAVESIADLDDADVTAELLEGLDQLSHQARGHVISSSLRSSAAATSLLEAIDSGIVDATEIPEGVRAGLLQHPDDSLRKHATDLLSTTVSSDRQRLIEEYLPALKIAGDVERGGQVFKQNCAQCHSIVGAGGSTGPDLSRVGTRSAKTLLVSILDPSREVSYELKTYVVLTSSGKILSGIITSDTPEVLTIRAADGRQEDVLREEIEVKRGTGKSIMPEGLEKNIAPRAMTDLIQFLKTPRRDAIE